MGINIISARFMLYAKSIGVDFCRTATLGHQQINLPANELLSVAREFYPDFSEDLASSIVSMAWAESFFKIVGAEKTTSFDADAFEGADLIHDFNVPIKDEHVGKFSAVVDSGTLEHIFDFPTAISNCMRMIEDGGHFIGVTPYNNLAGHGFYQFCPELMFRVFSENNGFRVVKMFVAQQADERPYRCASLEEQVDPLIVGHRVEYRSILQACLLVVAKKLATVPLFRTGVQQSDYASAWKVSK